MKGRDTRKGIKNNEDLDNGGRDLMRKIIQNKKDIFTSAEWTFNASQQTNSDYSVNQFHTKYTLDLV